MPNPKPDNPVTVGALPEMSGWQEIARRLWQPGSKQTNNDQPARGDQNPGTAPTQSADRKDSRPAPVINGEKPEAPKGAPGVNPNQLNRLLLEDRSSSISSSESRLKLAEAIKDVKLPKLTIVQQKHIDDLIKQLDSDVFATREAANRKLQRVGIAALPQMDAALHGIPPLELEGRRRLQRLCARFTSSKLLVQEQPLNGMANLARPESGQIKEKLGFVEAFYKDPVWTKERIKEIKDLLKMNADAVLQLSAQQIADVRKNPRLDNTKVKDAVNGKVAVDEQLLKDVSSGKLKLDAKQLGHLLGGNKLTIGSEQIDAIAKGSFKLTADQWQKLGLSADSARAIAGGAKPTAEQLLKITDKTVVLTDQQLKDGNFPLPEDLAHSNKRLQLTQSQIDKIRSNEIKLTNPKIKDGLAGRVKLADAFEPIKNNHITLSAAQRESITDRKFSGLTDERRAALLAELQQLQRIKSVSAELHQDLAQAKLYEWTRLGKSDTNPADPAGAQRQKLMSDAKSSILQGLERDPQARRFFVIRMIAGFELDKDKDFMKSCTKHGITAEAIKKMRDDMNAPTNHRYGAK